MKVEMGAVAYAHARVRVCVWVHVWQRGVGVI